MSEPAVGRQPEDGVLRDYLAPGLRVVFCGTAVSDRSAVRGHYYSGPGNEFWALLHDAGLTAERLRPEDDSRTLEFGIGLTDLAKRVAASNDRHLDRHFDVDSLIDKMHRTRPDWLAFNGKNAAKAARAALGLRGKVLLGPQSWRVATVAVFVLPSTSAANRSPRNWDGRNSRLDWFLELAGRCH
jgi:TDG/mug DNA glycosylase family protein